MKNARGQRYASQAIKSAGDAIGDGLRYFKPMSMSVLVDDSPATGGDIKGVHTVISVLVTRYHYRDIPAFS